MLCVTSKMDFCIAEHLLKWIRAILWSHKSLNLNFDLFNTQLCLMRKWNGTYTRIYKLNAICQSFKWHTRCTNAVKLFIHLMLMSHIHIQKCLFEGVACLCMCAFVCVHIADINMQSHFENGNLIIFSAFWCAEPA